MAEGKRAPIPLLIAAVGMVVQDLVVFAIDPITALSTASLGFAVFLAWLLLRGSRVAWVLVVLSATAQVAAPLTMNQSIWLAGSGVALLVLLLSPPSWKFVWKRHTQAASHSLHAVADRLSGGLWGVSARAVARLSETVGLPRRGVLVSILVACVAILLPLDGALRHLHQGADSGSVIVDVLYRVVAFVDGLAQIALVVTVVLAAYHYLTRERNASKAVLKQSTAAQTATGSNGGEGTQSPDPRAYSDLDRPKGWYIDPGEPGKMRHWGGENSPEWAGTTRTPRKILQAWQAQQ